MKLVGKIGVGIFVLFIVIYAVSSNVTSPVNNKLMECIESKFDNNEFTMQNHSYYAIYFCDNIHIRLECDYGDPFEFDELRIEGNVIQLSRYEMDKIDNIIERYENRLDQESRESFINSCEGKGDTLSYSLPTETDDIVRLIGSLEYNHND